jgi:6-pyruvoyltetrahydropterin/6-carboxytetrahydropterin synthase
MTIYLTVKVDFSAAHCILDYEGKCKNLHGHNYTIEVTVRPKSKLTTRPVRIKRELNDLNMVIDAVELKSIVKKVIEKYDHKNINDVLNNRNASVELLLIHIFNDIQKELSTKNVELYSVRAYETDDIWCEMRYE